MLTHVQCYKSTSFDTFKNYSKTECDDETKISKKSEEEDLSRLIKELYLYDKNYSIYDNFYFNFKIKQISKEFDLLRFGEDYVVNIEIKNKADREKIMNQLNKNKYYLESLNLKIYLFSYVAETNTLFKLSCGNISEVSFEELVSLLRNQKVLKNLVVDNLFNPSHFLISPFNATDKFLEKKYFLTHQQNEIKTNIMKIIDENSNFSIFAISGKPGTGKSLLIYDIALELINNCKVCIIHSGMLNTGHKSLIARGFDIYPARSTNTIDYTKYKTIIIDECQRMYPEQLEHIKCEVINNRLSLILSYDPRQTLASKEEHYMISDSIDSIKGVIKYELSNKIRTNKELSTFITSFFDLTKIDNRREIKYDNVKIVHLKLMNQVINYIRHLNEDNWVFINYTTSKFSKCPPDDFNEVCIGNAHEVIGQEFDKVIVIVDNTFSYNSSKKLAALGWSGVPYKATKMLYQAMTRVRSELCVIIIDNEVVLNGCLSIVGSR